MARCVSPTSWWRRRISRSFRIGSLGAAILGSFLSGKPSGSLQLPMGVSLTGPGVHDHRNPCSPCPESPFMFGRNRCSRSSGIRTRAAAPTSPVLADALTHRSSVGPRLRGGGLGDVRQRGQRIRLPLGPGGVAPQAVECAGANWQHLRPHLSYNVRRWRRSRRRGRPQSRRRDNSRDNRAKTPVRAKTLKSASPCATVVSQVR